MGALLAVLAFTVTAALAAGTASAEEPLWLCASESVTKANECLSLSANLETLILEDMGVPARVECAVEAVTSEGWVGPGAEDEITNVTFVQAACVKAAKAENLKFEEVANACEKVEKVAAVDLPWKTLLVKNGAAFEDEILTSGAGEPGYLVECKVAGLNVDDTCLSRAGHPPTVVVENLSEEESGRLLVTTLFLKNPARGEETWAKCKSLVTDENDGLVIGENLLTAVRGGVAVSLEVSEP